MIKKYVFLVCFLVVSLFVKATPFVTIWNMAINGSGANQITFEIGTTDSVMYSWTDGVISDTGYIMGPVATITGIPANGYLILSIDSAHFNHFKINNGLDRLRLMGLYNWGSVHWASMEQAFKGCNNLQNIPSLEIPDLTGVSNLSEMFSGCYLIQAPINIEFWYVDNVTNMSGMFAHTHNFSADLLTWNISNVVDMSHMFDSSIAFNGNISTWNTSNVLDMSWMFAYSGFNKNIGNWDVSKVTDMSGMFYNVISFNSPLSNWNVSNVKNMNSMFSKAVYFNQPIGSWNTSKVIDMGSMFAGDSIYRTYFNQNIGNWDVHELINMSNMFKYAIFFNSQIGSWNTSNVIDMSSMFENANMFNQQLNNWNTVNVTNLNSMFAYTDSFNHSLNSWNIINVVNMGKMFENAKSFNQPLDNWNVNNVVEMNRMFYLANSFNQSLENWNLNSSNFLNGMLDSSSMDCSNYSSTLKGWANNPNMPNNLTLGSANINYGLNAVTDRNFLISKGWTINGDIANNYDCYPTSISTIESQNAISNFYPNPTSSNASIDIFSEKNEKANIEVYNTLGQMVFNDKIKLQYGKNIIQLNTQNFTNGIYSVSIKIGEKQIVKQLAVSQ